MALVVIVQAGEVLAFAPNPRAQVDLNRIGAARPSFVKVDIIEVTIQGQLLARILRPLCQPLADLAILVAPTGADGLELADLLVLGVVDAASVVTVVAILDAQQDFKVVAAGTTGVANPANLESLPLGITLASTLAGSGAAVGVRVTPGSTCLRSSCGLS